MRAGGGEPEAAVGGGGYRQQAEVRPFPADPAQWATRGRDWLAPSAAWENAAEMAAGDEATARALREAHPEVAGWGTPALVAA